MLHGSPRLALAGSLLAGLSAAPVAPARAAEVPFPALPTQGPVASLQRSQPFVSEVRLGSFAHDPWSPEGGSADLNAELLFAKPYAPRDPFWAPFVPRPHLGGTASFDGRTSQVYAGLTWTLDLTSKLFVEAALGGAHNDGAAGVAVRPGRNALGCNTLFREATSLGYRVTDRVSVMGTMEHSSNGGLCNQNRGLTNYGARLGYTF